MKTYDKVAQKSECRQGNKYLPSSTNVRALLSVEPSHISSPKISEAAIIISILKTESLKLREDM